jgi:secreted trypsin-like serine protease
MLWLFVLVFVFIAQNTSATKYTCKYQMNSCGCSKNPAITARIFGNETAEPNTWDWAVSLRSSNHHFCAGSILNEWYIITAAHCIARIYILSTITICAGTNHLSACPQRRSIQNVVNHPAYNSKTYENDIAVIRVDSPFNITDTSIARICLPNATHSNEYPSAGTNVVAVGWGRNKTANKTNALQQVTLQVVEKSAKTCESSIYNHQLQLCAHTPTKGNIFLK